jgi:hypothetical protein
MPVLVKDAGARNARAISVNKEMNILSRILSDKAAFTSVPNSILVYRNRRNMG